MCPGMYTRLYTRVLNRYHWMYSATAYNHAYNDSGIFCIHASCHPQQMQDLTQVEERRYYRFCQTCKRYPTMVNEAFL